MNSGARAWRHFVWAPLCGGECEPNRKRWSEKSWRPPLNGSFQARLTFLADAGDDVTATSRAIPPLWRTASLIELYHHHSKFVKNLALKYTHQAHSKLIAEAILYLWNFEVDNWKKCMYFFQRFKLIGSYGILWLQIFLWLLLWLRRVEPMRRGCKRTEHILGLCTSETPRNWKKGPFKNDEQLLQE